MGWEMGNSQLPNSQLPIRELTLSVYRPARRFGGSLCIVLMFGMLAATAAGCAKARAATVPDGPPLAMPLPPPRVCVPIEPEEPRGAVPAVPETPAAEAPTVPPSNRPPRRAASTPPEKPEP